MKVLSSADYSLIDSFSRFFLESRMDHDHTKWKFSNQRYTHSRTRTVPKFIPPNLKPAASCNPSVRTCPTPPPSSRTPPFVPPFSHNFLSIYETDHMQSNTPSFQFIPSSPKLAGSRYRLTMAVPSYLVQVKFPSRRLKSLASRKSKRSSAGRGEAIMDHEVPINHEDRHWQWVRHARSMMRASYKR